MTDTILVINGPNLNLLGEREPHIYGSRTLADINRELTEIAAQAGFSLECFQSNHEGELIDKVQQGRHTTAGLLINPGGYAHTSVALRDALSAYAHPIVEVHLSNIYKREGFRHYSYISAVVNGMICGLGADGYRLALDALIKILKPA
ncbi:MAG: 3-dehydroquinate dehydratase, type [Vampirovibrio sp.]|jgi:3-dehydroquinate dehydratase-2|nr:3-dehydroquinate dehydratase, type [Vampirovibrio sp.]